MKLTIIALGFDSDQDWATTTSRKRRRVKKDDDETDEDYVVSTQPKPVTEDGVAKIMSSLLQARERWVIIKLLSRLEQSDDDTGIWHRVLKMHGYQILGAVLKEWHTESNIVITVTIPPLINL
jgi:histone-lysine N-methyltransferase SETD2